ncbi:MAG: DUF177 domain-containing protein [Bacteroidales bacterium]|jgi:uncharacterized metal-binding protein YceD (DUF177 family)|nr:DUF177 domain-containing protein [Bacteroidales bacterium]
MKTYLLPFAGLKNGGHHLDYHVDGTFFEDFPESEIQNANIHVHLIMEKQENMLVLNFTIDGVLQVTCDRCLDEFPFPIDKEETLIVKFGQSYEEISDDVIVLPSSEHAFDLHQHIYEYIMLALPIQRIHPDNADGSSGCDPEMMERLESMKTDNAIDPRWEALAQLKKDNNTK